ncbi:hypothetical protein [Streptomyces phaeochromogenes]|uniref:hypothetical protein n=1 Tax=Streptomyces phaeochromogenes TaxID=1923 RepID=UPI0037160345
MNSVHARVWRFSVEKGMAGAEAVSAMEIGQGPLPVSLAAVVNMNALACDLRKTVDQRVRDHEISLLLSYLTAGPGAGALGVDCSALDSSSGHIRRFVSECTGLGVMTAASEVLFDWKPGSYGLSSFDVLPGKLVGTYAKKGVRPDLLYDLAAGPLAGEARGRRRDHKQMLPVGQGTQPQRARLVKLAHWSVDHNEHDYFMSWVWLGTGGVYVDIFLPDDSPAAVGLKTGWIDVPGSGQPWRFRVPRTDARRRMDLESDYLAGRGDSTPESAGEGSSDATGASAGTAISRAAEAVETAMDRSFAREDMLGSFYGVEVRGRWIRGDAVGQAHHEVLLGVLGERVPLDHRSRRRLLASQTDRLDVFLEGRLLTLVNSADSPRPSWDRIQSELLE